MYSSRMRTARFNGHLGAGWLSVCGRGLRCLPLVWGMSAFGPIGCLPVVWGMSASGRGVSASGPGDVCLCLSSDSPWADTSPGQTSHLGRYPLPAQYMLGYTNPYP